MVHAHPNVQKYLGFTLIPQAGVAIGLATMTLTKLPQYGRQIQAIILAGTLIYELTGPVITKIALTQAGRSPRIDISKKRSIFQSNGKWSVFSGFVLSQISMAFSNRRR